jgi:O-antigen biosynthesis protein
MIANRNNAGKALTNAGRLSRPFAVLAREGILTPLRRRWSRVIGNFVQHYTTMRLAGSPWIADGRPVFLLISHRAGGGTERHVREMAAALRGEGVRPVLVHPGSQGGLLWDETDDAGRVLWRQASAAKPRTAEHILDLLNPVHSHVHHTMGLPKGFLDLLVDRGMTYDWTVHDYHSICPRVNLIGEGTIYCGEPDTTGCNRCLARLGDHEGRPVPESIVAWRDRSAHFLRGARRVFAPSQDVARRLKRYFPGLVTLVRPHPELPPDHESVVFSLVDGENVRVVVIGTIVAIKGSERLLACAADARRRHLPLEFHVLGTTDRDRALIRMGNVRITGRYREHEIHDRLATVRPHLAFLPSACPESFMFTLSTVMAARLFVVCFDLGAQAERVRAWGWGQVLARLCEPSAVNDVLLAAARRLATAPAAPLPPEPAAYVGILRDYYAFTPGELDRFGKAVTWHLEHIQHNFHGPRRRDNAHIH